MVIQDAQGKLPLVRGFTSGGIGMVSVPNTARVPGNLPCYFQSSYVCTKLNPLMTTKPRPLTFSRSTFY